MSNICTNEQVLVYWNKCNFQIVCGFFFLQFPQADDRSTSEQPLLQQIGAWLIYSRSQQHFPAFSAVFNSPIVPKSINVLNDCLHSPHEFQRIMILFRIRTCPLMMETNVWAVLPCSWHPNEQKYPLGIHPVNCHDKFVSIYHLLVFLNYRYIVILLLVLVFRFVFKTCSMLMYSLKFLYFNFLASLVQSNNA